MMQGLVAKSIMVMAAILVFSSYAKAGSDFSDALDDLYLTEKSLDKVDQVSDIVRNLKDLEKGRNSSIVVGTLLRDKNYRSEVEAAIFIELAQIRKMEASQGIERNQENIFLMNLNEAIMLAQDKIDSSICLELEDTFLVFIKNELHKEEERLTSRRPIDSKVSYETRRITGRYIILMVNLAVHDQSEKTKDNFVDLAKNAKFSFGAIISPAQSLVEGTLAILNEGSNVTPLLVNQRKINWSNEVEVALAEKLAAEVIEDPELRFKFSNKLRSLH